MINNAENYINKICQRIANLEMETLLKPILFVQTEDDNDSSKLLPLNLRDVIKFRTEGGMKITGQVGSAIINLEPNNIFIEDNPPINPPPNQEIPGLFVDRTDSSLYYWDPNLNIWVLIMSGLSGDNIEINATNSLCTSGETHIAITPSSTLGSNASISVGPLGTGFISAQKPTPGNILGGNCRGINSVDWQLVRSSPEDIASGELDVICGGENNETMFTNHSFIGGGINNVIRNFTSGNVNLGRANIINGGENNTIITSGTVNVIAGGIQNSMQSSGISSVEGCVIGGGSSNTITASQLNMSSSGILSGFGNTLSNGSSPTATTLGSLICGGRNNILSNSRDCFIGGGNSNQIQIGQEFDIGNSIVGGTNNAIITSVMGAGNPHSVICGGTSNIISSSNLSSILGGNNNTISSRTNGTILGGSNNIITNANLSTTPITVCGAGNSDAAVFRGAFVAGVAGGVLNNRVFVVGGGSGNLFTVEGINGNVHALGAYHSGAADYAEYFESELGSKIPIGTTISLNNNEKIEPCKLGDIPFGVISGTANLVGNDDNDEWYWKYEKNKFGENIYIEKEVEEKVYIEKIIELNEKKIINKNGKYYEIDIPIKNIEKEPVIEKVKIYNEDDNVIREDFIHKTIIRKDLTKKISEKFDPNMKYYSRKDRPEWNIVGILGQVHIRKGQPVNKNWIKIKNVCEDVELWLIK